MHEEARDSALVLPGELLRAGPVAAQADLDVPLGIDVPLLDEPVHRRPVRDLDTEDLGARIRMGVEMDEAERAVSLGAGPDIRLGDRVVTAEHDRDRARPDDLADRAFDRLMRRGRIRRQDGRVAVVDQPELGHRIDLGLEVRAEAGPRTVGDQIVGRRADDCSVDAFQLGRILRVRERPEREQARVVRLLAVLAPALERIDHRSARL